MKAGAAGLTFFPETRFILSSIIYEGPPMHTSRACPVLVQPKLELGQITRARHPRHHRS